MHIYTYVYIHTYTHIYTNMHTYIHTDIHTYTHTHTYIHICMHTHMYVHMHTYIHAHLHIYKHIYIRSGLTTFLHEDFFFFACLLYPDSLLLPLWLLRAPQIQADRIQPHLPPDAVTPAPLPHTAEKKTLFGMKRAVRRYFLLPLWKKLGRERPHQRSHGSPGGHGAVADADGG